MQILQSQYLNSNNNLYYNYFSLTLSLLIQVSSELFNW